MAIPLLILEQTLTKTECINLEISAKHFSKFGYTCSDVLKLLFKSGFDCFKSNNNHFSEEIGVNYIPEREYENIVAKK